MSTPRLREIEPIHTDAGYALFREREIPDKLDQVRARALLNILTTEQVERLREWLPTYYEAFTMFAYGKVRHGWIPHTSINFIARKFGYKWDGERYIR